MERYARLAMRQYEQYTNLSDELCALPGSFAVFALGMLGQEWRQLVWDYLDLCDDEHSRLQEKFLREYVKQFGFTADTVPVFVRGVLSMQDMKYSKDYAAWMANAESLGALLETKSRLSEIVPSGFPPTRMMTRMIPPVRKQKPARKKCCNTHGKQFAM